MRLWAPRVLIDVSPEAFTFIGKGVRRSVATCLYVSQHPESRAVVSVGQEASGSSDVIRVDLFGRERFSIDDSTQHLEAYLAHGFRLLRTWSIIRPLVTVRGAARLAPFLGGQQEGVLRNVLTHIGAWFVAFEP